MNIKNTPGIKAGGTSDFFIRVKSNQGVSIQGKLEHIQTGQVQYFDDFLEMLVLLQEKLDENNYPQCDTELRNFCNV